MRKAVLACLLLIAMATVMAQEELPPPFPRTNATKLLENDRINVWDIIWPRGQPTVMHRHIYDQVGTYYQRGGRVIRTPDGEQRSNITEVGSLSTTRKGTTHIEEGNTDPPLRAVFIELKQEKPKRSHSGGCRRCGLSPRGRQTGAGRRPRHRVGLCIVGARAGSAEVPSPTRDDHRLAGRRLAAGHARRFDDYRASQVRDDAAPRSRLCRNA
jgi:hypothetical protein